MTVYFHGKKKVVILSHVLRISMTVYGVFRPAARPVADVYGHRNASPGLANELAIMENQMKDIFFTFVHFFFNIVRIFKCLHDILKNVH